MEEAWKLLGVGGRPIRFITHGRAGGPAQSISPVLTVADLCRRLGKSQRQIYRYLKAGRLHPCGRVLGQWLFSPEEAAGLARSTLPRTLQRFFWDAKLSDISVEDHRDFVLGRLLEFGDPSAMRWVFQTYSRKTVEDFLRTRGAAVLSQRTWNFWNVHLVVPHRRYPSSWRQRGRAWGGAQ